jgi:hypothetical protein
MQDRPTAYELLEAVRGFLENQVIPTSTGGRQFHARVAANVLAIVARELRDEDAFLRSEWRRLARLVDEPTDREPPADGGALRTAVAALNAALATRIRAGDADREPERTAVVAHLRATIADKLRIANPAYLEAG